MVNFLDILVSDPSNVFLPFFIGFCSGVGIMGFCKMVSMVIRAIARIFLVG